MIRFCVVLAQCDLFLFVILAQTVDLYSDYVLSVVLAQCDVILFAVLVQTGDLNGDYVLSVVLAQSLSRLLISVQIGLCL